MRVVFIGASQFGKRCLEKIYDLDCVNIVGVVTAPKQFSISYSKNDVTNVLHADVATFCETHDIPMTIIKDGMKDKSLFERVKAWNPDIFIVVGWYHMVPKSWRAIAPAYGLHASLLPDYSGGAPLVWAMINGEKKTGITFFQFADGVDNGPIVGQSETMIMPDDTIATLYGRIEDLGINLVSFHLPKIADGTAILEPQDERRRRLMPQRSPEDGIIDWNQPSDRIHNFVRAQTKPYPGAFTFFNKCKITIWTGRAIQQVDLPPGKFHFVGNRVIVGCYGLTGYELLSIAIDGIEAPIHDLVSLHNRMAS